MKVRLIIPGIFWLFEISESLITTLIVSDVQSRTSISACLDVFRQASISVLHYEANSSQSLGHIHSGVCAELEKTKDLKAIIDYSPAETVNRLLNDISERLHVPLLRMNSSVVTESTRQTFQLLLYPGAVLQLLVLKDFLREENRKGRWQSAALLLPPRSKDLKNFVFTVQSAEQAILIRQWTQSMDVNSEMIDKAVDRGIQEWIVGLTSTEMKKFFELMSAKGLMNAKHRFLLPHADVEEGDLALLAYSGADIQVFRVEIGRASEPLTVRLTRVAATISLPLRLLPSWNSSCTTPWSDGERALDEVRRSVHDEAGIIEKPDLLRAPTLDVNVQIRRLTTGGSVKLYSWNNIQGLVENRHRVKHHTKRQANEGPMRPHLRVTTIADPPFIYVSPSDKDGKPNVGNARFYGLSIQIFALIAKRLDINYTIALVKDGRYGSVATTRNRVQRWNGMIGELLRGEADVAVAPLTITYERGRVVHFSRSYMTSGVSAIFQKPQQVQRPINFCGAFSSELWGLVIGAAIVTSIVMYFTAHVSHSEWQQKEGVQTNDFSLTNSVLLVTGAFVFKGTNLSAKSAATRLVCFIWWFFILLLVLSYFAVMLRRLKYEKMESPIKSMEDLAQQTYIKYGTTYGGSTYNQFRYSPIAVYKRMFEFMQENYLFQRSTREGMLRVQQGNFAFILESTISSYYTARNCSLISLDSYLSSQEYGFAFPKDSLFRERFSLELQRLIDEQSIDGIINYWMRKHGIKNPCPKDSDDNIYYGTLDIYLMSPLFFGLMVGLALALVICICEICYRSCRKKDRGEMTSSEYLKLAFSSWGSKRPLRSKPEDRDAEYPLNQRPTEVYG